MKATAFYATLDTRHFAFEALDVTESLARERVMTAWALHAAQTGADLGYITPDSIEVRALEFGVAYRDGVAL